MGAKDELLNLKDEAKALHLMSFFKTKKGQYGEGDLFLGICVPKTREIAKKYYKNITENQLQSMLNSPYHEIRLCALLAMVMIYEKTDKKSAMLELYIKNTKNINNWDLVDLTAPKIIGADYVKSKNPYIIKKFSESGFLWEERIAIVSQLAAVKAGEFDLLIELCEKFLSHKHDLIHKATGWLLREASKKDEKILINFLNKYYKQMPRTALRYSIEKLNKEQKAFYMKR